MNENLARHYQFTMEENKNNNNDKIRMSKEID